MVKKLVWCLFLFTEIFVSAQLSVGERCGQDNKGLCVLVDACTTALDQIRQRKNHSLERCGWQQNIEIVCCMDIKTRTSDRKSVEACRKYGQDFTVEPFITHGSSVKLGEFPHMAALGFPRADDPADIVWGDCGGSLISENYVLTAGHCMFRVDGKLPAMVRLGKIDLFGNDDNADPQDISVAENILNPDYEHLKKLNDIALIRLSRNAVFTKNVKPICLYTEPDSPKGLIVTGWGVTEKGNISRYLLQAPVSPMELNSCNDTFQKSAIKRPIFSTHLCAVSRGALPTDTCQGDSGGPIQVGNLKNNFGTQFIIVGVTSYGRGCGNNFPSIYTRVYSYLKWIEDTVW